MNTDHGWWLSIDFGTSFTAAAVAENGRLDVLEINGKRRIPSAVFLNEDGTLSVGESALNRAALAPERVELTPKAYLEEGESENLLGDRPIKVTTMVGRIYHEVLQEALRQHNGVPPERVILTHPATWSEARLQLLVAAAKEGGIRDPELVPEPEAAAYHLSSPRSGGKPVPEGAAVLVYDLGGGTFDTAALRHTGDRFEVIGKPGGDERIGGELFDDLLAQKVGETAFEPDEWKNLSESEDREWRRANFYFRTQVRQAKEEVSEAATYPFYVPAPIDRDVQVTREQFEELIREHVQRTLDLLEDTMKGAGLEASDLAALYLVGGSSRIPLVAHEVRARFGRADFKGEPKAVVSLGAAGRDPIAEPPPPSPPPPPKKPKPDGVKGPRRSPTKVAAALLVAAALVGGGIALAAGGGDSSSSAFDPGPSFDYSYDDSGGDYSGDYDYSYDYSSESSDDLIGTWSGTVTDDVDESTSEYVTVDVVSFDGYDDGTLETLLDDAYCDADLAWQETSGSEEIFEAADSDGDCATSTLSLEYDSSDDTVWYTESWENLDGETVSYSGSLERE